MKKYLIVSIFLASILNAMDIEGEIKIGGSASFGVDGVSRFVKDRKVLLKLALDRENILDESIAKIPKAKFLDDIKKANSNVGNDSETENKKSEYKESIFLKSLQIDRTLLDASLKFKDIGTKVGLVVKSRPYKYGQAHNLGDINRVYLYANVNTDYLKLDSTLYLEGYNKETLGLNVYSEEGYRDKKTKGQLDLKSSITPIPKFIVTPVLDIDYSGKLDKVYDFDVKLGGRVNLIDTDDNLITFTGKYTYGKNKAGYVIDNLEKDIKSFGYGNTEVEYYKNWEIGELTLDTEYNKDKTIEGKDGKAAYRYIGIKDLNKGHLTGLNGSIRAIGTPTGALYGDRVTTLVIKEATDTLFKKLQYGNELRNIMIDGIGIISSISNRNAINDIPNISKVILSKDYKEHMIRYVSGLYGIKLKGDDEVSDFYFTHLAPKSIRNLLVGTLIDVPYEDSKANKDYLSSLENSSDSESLSNEGGENSTGNETAVVYQEDENKVISFGSTAKNEKKINLIDDTKNTIFGNEINQDLVTTIDKAIEDINKGAITTLFSYFSGNISKLGEYLGKGKLFQLLLEEPEKLSMLDMYAGLQINKSESEYVGEKYYKELSKYFETVKYLDEIQRNKNLNTQGFEGELKYRYKKAPFNISLKYSNNNSTANSYGSKQYTGNDAKLHSSEEYILVLKQPNGQKFEKIESRKGIFGGSYKDGMDDRVKYLNTNIEFKSLENVFNNKIEFNTNYDGEKLKINTGINLDINNINYTSLGKEVLNYNTKTITWGGFFGNTEIVSEEADKNYTKINKFDINYSRLALKPYFNISYIFTPYNWLELIPKFSYEGNYTYVNYKSIKGSSQIDDETPVEYNGEVSVFKRDENNLLIKSDVSDLTGDTYFDSLSEGDSVDISKISKYIIGNNPDKYFQKETTNPKSNWSSLQSSFVVGLDSYVLLGNNFKIGYHLLIPTIFKGNNLDGILLKNGISLTFKF